MDASMKNDFACQLNAAREQNLRLLEEVSSKISTIKRLESESSKLQHQLLSLEMIVSENEHKCEDDSDAVRRLQNLSIETIKLQEEKTKLQEEKAKLQEEKTKLQEEKTKLQEENTKLQEEKNKLQEIITKYVHQIDELKQDLVRKGKSSKEANKEIEHLMSRIETKDQSLSVFATRVADKHAELFKQKALLKEQHTEITRIQEENAVLRTKDTNGDILKHQNEQLSNQLSEIKEENEFLKAQLDVYKSDFEMERQARQDIANEREEILSDLKLLQRRNQQLIDESQSRKLEQPSIYKAYTTSNPSAPPENAGNRSSARFVCPICNGTLPDLMSLQKHAQACLVN